MQTKPDDCVPSLYSVQLLKNNQEIARSDTLLTGYSFEETDSDSTYRVIMSPILSYSYPICNKYVTMIKKC